MIYRLLSSPRRRVSLLAAIAILSICFAGIPQVSAVTIDGTNVIVPNSVLIDPTIGGTIGSYTYDSANDSYYIDLFGSSTGLRQITRTSPNDPWQSATLVSGTNTTPSDQFRFYRSSDVAGGNVSATDTGTSIMSSILLNPAPLTIQVPAPANYDESFGYGPVVNGKISITYAANSLAFITDGGTAVKTGSTVHFDWTKKIYRWDLRGVGTTTTVQPDYDTGKSGDPQNPNPGGLFGADGYADWNDVLSSVLTEQAFRQAYTDYRTAHPSAPALPATTSTNLGRQFAWSTDGQSLYVVDHNSTVGGVYKVSATQETAKLIYYEPAGVNSNVIAEPTVIPTTHRNLGAGSGDQVIFDGTSAGGNAGGISFVVDNGTSVSAPQVLVSGQTFRNYAELSSGGSVTSTAADSTGNIYFYESATHELHKYDTQGRLSTLLNKAQLYEVNETEKPGSRSDSGGMLRLQVREDSSGTYVTYRGNNRYIGQVQVFATGDFNHDGVVNQADKQFFIDQFNKTYHGNAPLTVTGLPGATNADYVNYIAADINGSSNPTGTTAPALSAASVTIKDFQVLKQFISHTRGDFNWDGKALNTADWGLFNGNYGLDPVAHFSTTGAKFSYFDGDVTGDGLVSNNDYLALALPGDLNFDSKVDGTDSGILTAHLSQDVSANDGAYALGDVNGDGVVDSADLAILNAHQNQSLVTWNGGSGALWSTASNWVAPAGTLSQADKHLVFSGATQLTSENDLAADTPFYGIVFKFDAGSFTLQGNRVKLSSEVVNQSVNPQTIALDIQAGGSSLTFDTGSAGISVTGVISEATPGVSLIKLGTGTLSLSQANTISGNIDVREGNLNLLGSLASASNVEVAAGAELTLAGTSGSSLSTTANIANNGQILVTALGQTAGNITGTGSLFVQTGSDLTATSIVQSSLTIGGYPTAAAVPEPSAILQFLSVGCVCGGLAFRKMKAGKSRSR